MTMREKQILARTAVACKQSSECAREDRSQAGAIGKLGETAHFAEIIKQQQFQKF